MVRTVMVEGEPWFVAADVCGILGITNPTVAMNVLDTDEKAKFSLGYGQPVNIMNESGLYTLILRSDKKEAIPFRRWVTKEVLPTIRKTGSYGHPVQPQFPIPQTMAEALRLAADPSEQNERLALEN